MQSTKKFSLNQDEAASADSDDFFNLDIYQSSTESAPNDNYWNQYQRKSRSLYSKSGV